MDWTAEALAERAEVALNEWVDATDPDDALLVLANMYATMAVYYLLVDVRAAFARMGVVS